MYKTTQHPHCICALPSGSLACSAIYNNVNNLGKTCIAWKRFNDYSKERLAYNLHQIKHNVKTNPFLMK